MEQKQPPKVFCKKRWPATLLRKRLCYRCFPKQPPEVFCKKRWPATLFKKRLWHRCFPVNFAEFLRTSFLQNTSGRLVLMEISCRGCTWWGGFQLTFFLYEKFTFDPARPVKNARHLLLISRLLWTQGLLHQSHLYSDKINEVIAPFHHGKLPAPPPGKISPRRLPPLALP